MDNTNKSFFNKLKPYLPWTIRIIVAVLFIFSAYSKLYPNANLALPTFEAKQLEPLGFSKGIAPYFSRLLIALEFALGFALLQPHFLKRLVVPGTIALLAVFCIHLSYSIATNVGGNCGCFGDLIEMTPTEALIKNLITIGLLVWLMRMLPKDNRPQNMAWIGLLYTLPALALFMIAPIKKSNLDAPNANMEAVLIEDEPFEDTSNVIELDSSGTTGKIDPKTGKVTEIVAPPKDTSPKKVTSKFSKFVPAAVKLDEGKKILCFFAPGCDHCRATAKALTRMRKEDPNFPKIYIIFMEEAPEEIPAFFAFAGAEYSHQVTDIGDFWGIFGGSNDVPGVVYLWNGNIRYFGNGTDEQGPNPNMFTEKALRKELDKVK